MLYTLNLAMCFAFLANVYGEFMQVLNARYYSIIIVLKRSSYITRQLVPQFVYLSYWTGLQRSTMAPSKWMCSKDVSMLQSEYYFSIYCLMLLLFFQLYALRRSAFFIRLDLMNKFSRYN